MALGKNDSNYTQGDLLVLNLITRDSKKNEIPATFQAKKKNDEGDWEVVDTYSYVTGDLFRLEPYTNDWVDEKTKKKMVSKGVKVMLKDQESGDMYLVDLKFNMLTRGLVNKILALTSFKDVTLGVFRGNNGMNANYVKVGKEKVSWKFDKADLPPPVEIKHPATGEVLQRDFSVLDDFFLKAVEEFALENGLVKNAPPKVESQEEVDEGVAAEVAEIVDEVNKSVGEDDDDAF